MGWLGFMNRIIIVECQSTENRISQVIEAALFYGLVGAVSVVSI